MHIHLETERLVLRRLTEDDLDLLVALDGDHAVMRHITGRPTTRAELAHPILPRMLSDYERHPGLATWAAVDRATGAFLGWFSLRPDERGVPELGYRLRRAAWGHGYATEGATALLRKAFTEAVDHRSRRVMEKACLRYRETVHDWDEPLEGVEHGDVVHAAERDEWLATY